MPKLCMNTRYLKLLKNKRYKIFKGLCTHAYAPACMCRLDADTALFQQLNFCKMEISNILLTL